MEGVSTVMPLAISAGAGVLKGVLASAASGGAGADVSDAAEARARAVEEQARRQAEELQARTREEADALREKNQHREARARIGAADSGVTLSGSSLLSLQGMEQQGEAQVARLLGESSRRVEDILSSGAEQAQSIRLSGRRPRAAQGGGLGSLIGLGAQVLSSAGKWGAPPATFPTSGLTDL